MFPPPVLHPLHIVTLDSRNLFKKVIKRTKIQTLNQNNTIHGQRPHMENRQTQQKTQNNQNNIYKAKKANEQLRLRNGELGPHALVG